MALARALPVGQEIIIAPEAQRDERLSRHASRAFGRGQASAPWTARKIRDTLKLQGYESPCTDTIRKYMIKRSGDPGGKRSTTWLPFLRNHLDVSWGMDFLTVPTLGLARLYVFLVIEHGRRQIVYWATTYSPSMA